MKKIILTVCVLLVATMAFAADIPVSADVAEVVRIDNAQGDIYWNDANADGILGNEAVHPDGASDRKATVVVYANTARTYTLAVSGDFTLDGPSGATVPYDIQIGDSPIGAHSKAFSKIGTMDFAILGFINPPKTATAGHYADMLTLTVGF